MPKKLKRVAGELGKLRLTPLIQRLAREDSTVAQGIQHLQFAHRLFTSIAAELLPRILEEADKTGLKLHPDQTRLLIKLLDHVRERTGEPRYPKVCDLLDNILPDDGKPLTPDALKQFYYRAKIKRAKSAHLITRPSVR